MYVDVHTHLTHETFKDDLVPVIKRSIASGLKAIVVNGLEPKSNRHILKLSEQYPEIIPALGIYPIDAVNGIVQDLPFPVAKFDVDEEIDFIAQQASAGKIKAIGECGLDGYWIKEDTFREQERVFEKLIDIAQANSLPLIIHTRKLEKRAMEILEHHQVEKVDFHCYGGKVKLALRAAQQHGWYFSIPANARKNQAFTKLLQELPEECILTETDAPYLSPIQGERNEPNRVIGTIDYLAELRSWDVEKAKNMVWKNYQTLFSIT